MWRLQFLPGSDPAVVGTAVHVCFSGELQPIDHLPRSLMGFREIDDGIDVALIRHLSRQKDHTVVDGDIDVFVFNLLLFVDRALDIKLHLVVIPVNAGTSTVASNINRQDSSGSDEHDAAAADKAGDGKRQNGVTERFEVLPERTGFIDVLRNSADRSDHKRSE